MKIVLGKYVFYHKIRTIYECDCGASYTIYSSRWLNRTTKKVGQTIYHKAINILHKNNSNYSYMQLHICNHCDNKWVYVWKNTSYSILYRYEATFTDITSDDFALLLKPLGVLLMSIAVHYVYSVRLMN